MVHFYCNDNGRDCTTYIPLFFTQLKHFNAFGENCNGLDKWTIIW